MLIHHNKEVVSRLIITRSFRVIKEREMREKMKKEKEEVRVRRVMIDVSLGSDPLATVSARRRRRKNVRKRSKRSGMKRL